MANEISLTSYGLLRPEKIRWSCEPTDDVASTIRRKSSRSFMRQADSVLATAGITLEIKPLSEAEYVAWLPFYEAKMIEQNYSIFATPAWYQEQVAAGKVVIGFMYYQGTQLVGGLVATASVDHQSINSNFKASEQIDTLTHNASLGAIIDFNFLKYANEQHYPTILMGRSRNAFGVTNRLSYLEYKLRFGTTPIPDQESKILDFVPVNDEGWAVFFGSKTESEALQLFTIEPKDSHVIPEDAALQSKVFPATNLEY